MLWWEKTVEYFFVREYVDLKTFLCPLDGNHESAGDAIFANINSWVLIEFKKDRASISSEAEKFENFEEAKAQLLGRDQHHFLIYGALDSDEEFCLESQTYFSAHVTSMESVLTSGVPHSQFLLYLRELIELKMGAKISSGGFSYIAGINSESGRIVRCLKMHDYAEAMKQQQHVEIQHESRHRTRSHPELSR